MKAVRPGLGAAFVALLGVGCGRSEPLPLDEPERGVRPIGGAAVGAEPEPASAVPPVPPPTAEQRARARLETFLGLARGGDGAQAARLVVYRLDAEPARRWKDVCDYGREAERRHVDALVERTRRLLELGPVRLLSFHTAEESEGSWQVWSAAFGEEGPGGKQKRASFAFLEVGGELALGGIEGGR